MSNSSGHWGATAGGLSIWEGGGVGRRCSCEGFGGGTFDLLWVVAIRLGTEQDRVW